MEDSVVDDELMVGFPPAPPQQVTLENWRLPPYNRWAFQHVRELIPSAEIWHGLGPVRPLEPDPVDLSLITFDDGNGSSISVDRFLAANQTDGFLVLREGRVVSEQYFNGLVAHRPHILMSVSKSLTATLAGVLVDRGLLDPEMAVTALVPELTASAFGDCTLRHLLDMTAGVAFSEDYLANHGLIVDYREVSGWKPPSPANTGGDLRSWLGRLEKDGEHGAAFHYVSPCSDLLGWIIERAGGARSARNSPS